MFREFFLTFTDNKSIFVNCKSVSVMIGTPSFLLQLKLIWFKILPLTICYMTSMQQDFNFFKLFFIFSHYWLLLKCYHLMLILISSIGLGKTFNRSWIKFSGKILWFKWLQHFLSSFTELLVFAFVVVYIVIGVIVMYFWLRLTNILVFHWSLNWAYWLSLKAIEFNGMISREICYNINRS